MNTIKSILQDKIDKINFDVDDIVYCISQKYDSMGYATNEFTIIETKISQIEIEAKFNSYNDNYIDVYIYVNNRIKKPNSYYASDRYSLKDFGKIIFLNKREAEEVLKNMENS